MFFENELQDHPAGNGFVPPNSHFQKIRPTNRWPLLIIALALLFAGVTGWSIGRARTGTSPVLDKRYYEHGLAYDAQREAAEAARAMGWKISAAPEEDGLVIRLSDAMGNPVANAEATAILPQSGQPESRLHESAPGLYRLPLAPDSQVREVMLRLAKDGATLSRRILVQPVTNVMK